MKIYKVYTERDAESKENTTAAFENELLEQNGGKEKFYTDFDEAKKAYDDIEIFAEASRLSYAGSTTYRFDGKLIEETEIDDEEYAEMLKDGADIKEIYLSARSWGCDYIKVSSPFKMTDEED